MSVVDADRKAPDPKPFRGPASVLVPGGRHQALHVSRSLDLDVVENAKTALKIPEVAQRLETDEVVLERTAQDLGAPRQLQEDVGRRKRNVQEEADQVRHLVPAQTGSDAYQVVAPVVKQLGEHVYSLVGTFTYANVDRQLRSSLWLSALILALSLVLARWSEKIC